MRFEEAIITIGLASTIYSEKIEEEFRMREEHFLE